MFFGLARVVKMGVPAYPTGAPVVKRGVPAYQLPSKVSLYPARCALLCQDRSHRALHVLCVLGGLGTEQAEHLLFGCGGLTGPYIPGPMIG